MRLEGEADVAGLQDRQPGCGGGLGNPAVTAQGGQVEQLTRSSGEQPQAAIKQVEIGDRREGAHVTLDIGGRVLSEPLAGLQLPIVDARVAAAIQPDPEVSSRLYMLIIIKQSANGVDSKSDLNRTG